MGAEKREYPRLEQEFPVRFDVVDTSLTRPAVGAKREGAVKNISGGGLYFISPRLSKWTIKKLLAHCYNLSIEFYLPDFQNKINILGEVRWEKGGIKWWSVFPKKWELGVKFIYVKPEDKDAILKYVINKQIESQLMEAS
jgi:hypothetical protein